MKIGSEDLGGITVVVLVLGVIIGYAFSAWAFSRKKNRVIGFAPNTLSKWHVDTAWTDILSEKDPQAVADKLLDELSKVIRKNEVEGDALDGAQAENLQKLNDIKKRIESVRESGGSRIEEYSIQHGPFSRVMAKLSDIRLDYDRLNNTQLNFRRRKEFLRYVSDGLGLNEITKAMNRDTSTGFQDEPYGESLKNIDAELESLAEFGVEHNETIMSYWLNIKPE